MARYSTPITQYLDDAGNPLVGGKLTFYASGTENLQNTYNTEALTIANTNPVILDGAGRADASTHGAILIVRELLKDLTSRRIAANGCLGRTKTLQARRRGERTSPSPGGVPGTRRVEAPTRELANQEVGGSCVEDRLRRGRRTPVTATTANEKANEQCEHSETTHEHPPICEATESRPSS